MCARAHQLGGGDCCVASYYSYIAFADLLHNLDKLAANAVQVEYVIEPVSSISRGLTGLDSIQCSLAASTV